MVKAIGQSALAKSFDETSFLFVGVALLIALLTAQIIWTQYRRKGPAARRESGSGSHPDEEGGREDRMWERGDSPAAGAANETVEPEDCDFEGEAVICPECSRPTEAEYRFCRHCAGDTGQSYVSGRSDDGSSRSGMF